MIVDEIMSEANKEVEDLTKKLPDSNKVTTALARAQYRYIKQ
jgi:hypothetical protein